MGRVLPTEGRAPDEVLAELRRLKAGDADWEHGRVPLYVFKGSDAAAEVGRAAFFEYFTENALGGRRAFPSVKRMEEEVVEIALDLFHAPPGAHGFMTSGGTESIIQAVQTCRDWTRACRSEPDLRGTIVLPESGHPAFDKAARLMDLRVVRVPVGPDFRADPAAMEAAIGGDTIMIVGSAPSFPYGSIDPIAELGAVAQRRDVWLHVDACVGGYLAPFVKMIGRDVPDFDLSVPGVASLSADLHKLGFCPKPASTVFYRDGDKAGHHHFETSDWPSGRFLTSTIVGTRPAGGVAGAWAVMQALGRDGYCAIARDLMEFIDAYRRRISGITGLAVLGDPDLSIVAFGSEDVDIFAVAERMQERGWVPGLLQKPKAIHRMMSMLHAPAIEAYVCDLEAAVAHVREAGRTAPRLQATY